MVSRVDFSLGCDLIGAIQEMRGFYVLTLVQGEASMLFQAKELKPGVVCLVGLFKGAIIVGFGIFAFCRWFEQVNCLGMKEKEAHLLLSKA